MATSITSKVQPAIQLNSRISASSTISSRVAQTRSHTSSMAVAGPQGVPGVFATAATQAEAEAGVSNTTGMSPLRTAQAIASLESVQSVFGREGAVTAATNDYTWAQVNKATSNIADITTKSHTSLTDIGTNTHAQIDTHVANTSNPHSVTKTQVGLGNVTDNAQLKIASNLSDLNSASIALTNLGLTATATELNYTDGVTSAIQTQLDTKVDENAGITGATKTKVTYDAKGLVTAGADATQDDIGDGTTNKQYSATDKTKLAGVETAADVTDATNVDAAGATMNTDTTLAGNGYFLDEDDMVSNSATKVPSQQSTKAYVDAAVIASGSGDVVGPSSSVDSEIALFDSTTGKLIKRATGTGYAKVTSGVLSAVSTATAAADILAVAYPVGAIYISTLSTNPATLLGFGTWAAFGAGRTLVSLNSGDTDFDTVEETGGSKTHTHTLSGAAQITMTGSNDPLMNRVAAPGGTWTGTIRQSNSSTASSLTSSTGANLDGTATSSSNVPPYIVVYMWKRTA